METLINLYVNLTKYYGTAHNTRYTVRVAGFLSLFGIT
jgi:hypothetical protein